MILEDVPPTMKTVCNLFIHLIDACMHQNLVNERTPHMLQRKRASELTIFGASMIYFFAWSTLQIRFDGSLIPRPIWLSPDPLVSGSYWHAMPVMFTLIIPPVSWLLLLLLLLGGLPVLLSAGWGAFKAGRYLTLFLTLLGFFSPFVTVLLALMPFILQANSGIDVQTLLWEFMLIGFLGLVVDLALMFFAIQQVPPQRRVTHYVLYPATVIPFVMAVGLVILVIWMAPFLIAAWTDKFSLGFTFSYIFPQGILFLIMGMALLFTIRSLAKIYKARNLAVGSEQILREMEM